jgi:hypothetical protein
VRLFSGLFEYSLRALQNIPITPLAFGEKLMINEMNATKSLVPLLPEFIIIEGSGYILKLLVVNILKEAKLKKT